MKTIRIPEVGDRVEYDNKPGTIKRVEGGLEALYMGYSVITFELESGDRYAIRNDKLEWLPNYDDPYCGVGRWYSSVEDCNLVRKA